MCPLSCPQCSSTRLYKDGLRYVSGRATVQRWLCRECGHRFSNSQLLKKKSSSPINRSSDYPFNRQICDLTEESKNLAKIEQLPKTELAGTTQQTLDIKGKLVEFSWWMKKEGYAESTILGRTKLLKILAKRGANLYDPETIKSTIAKQTWCEGRKANAVDAYSSFLKMIGGIWQPPHYQGIRKIPFIPTETEIDQVISGCSNRMATFLQLLKETGMRSGEAWQLKWIDLDTVTKTIRITPEKGSNPRIARLSPKLVNMIQTSPKNYGERIFSKPHQPLDHHRDTFSQQRKRITHKLQNPRLLKITFHTLRHWKATMEYHRTRDILYVKQLLGHRRIENTLKYIQLAKELFKDQVEYISKVAKTEGEACALIDDGFDFVCDFIGNKLFRKNKY